MTGILLPANATGLYGGYTTLSFESSDSGTSDSSETWLRGGWQTDKRDCGADHYLPCLLRRLRPAHSLDGSQGLGAYSSPAHIRSISSLMTAGPDILPVLRSPWKKSTTGSRCSLTMDTVGTHIPCWTSKDG